MSLYFFNLWLLVACTMVFIFSGYILRNFRVAFWSSFSGLPSGESEKMIHDTRAALLSYCGAFDLKLPMCLDLLKHLSHPSCNEVDELLTYFLLPLLSLHRMARFLFLFGASRYGLQYFSVEFTEDFGVHSSERVGLVFGFLDKWYGGHLRWTFVQYVVRLGLLYGLPTAERVKVTRDA